jgi:hypothetical protein
MAAPLPALPDPAAIGQALTFTWEDLSGATWRTDPVREGSAPTPVALKYVVGVFRDDDRVGVARRRIAVSAADGLYVEHVALEINDVGAKGNGFATAYWKACLAQYKSLAIDRVTFLADDEGKTFWARDPVRFRVPACPRSMLANWVNPGPDTGEGADGLYQAAARLGIPGGRIMKFIDQINAHPQTFTPADLYANDIGQLLLSGASWKAVVDV